MKKHTLVLMAASIGLLFACTSISEIDSKENAALINESFVERVIFEAPVIRSLGDDVETRSSLSQEGENAIHFHWETTDTVGIYPEKGAQVFFEMVDGTGTESAVFDGGGWALRDGVTYSCYYPFVCDMKLNRNAIPVSFTNQEQKGVSTYENSRLFLATKGTSSSSGSLRFSFQMLNTIIRIKAIGLPTGTYSKLTLTTDEPLFVQQGTFGLNDMSITGKTYSNTLEISLKGFKLTEASTEQNPVLFYLTSAPVDLRGHTVTVRVFSDDGSIYKCVKTPTKAYEAGTWGGLKCQMDNESVKYSKASSITAGGTYLIVDANDQKLFKGSSDGSFVSISTRDNVITDKNGSLVDYEFTVENSGNNYYLKFNNGKYLICNYTGNAAGLGYVNSRSEVTYPFTLTTGNNGAFFFSTTQSNDASKTGQVLYYKSEENRFKIGGTGSSFGVHLYLKDGVSEPVKQDRGLSFNPESVTCTLGDTPQKPILSGEYTTVTYSSSDSKIATVNTNGTVTPVAAGTVTITASAAEDNQYNADSASYTLIIKKVSTSGTYVQVTSTDQIYAGGEYVIAYVDGTTQKAFKPFLNAGKNAFQTSNNAVDVLIIDSEIDAAEADACRFTLANQDGTNNKYSLIIPEADGTSDYYWYVYRGGVFTAMKVDDSADTGYRSTFVLSSEGKLTLTGTNTYLFRYSSGSFTASTGPAGASNLYLFIRSDGAAKQKQVLNFNDATVTWNLGTDCEIGGSYNYPQLVNGAQTTVTYSAEPESVAKVESGKIKINGTGTATITATAAKSDKYYVATASYTLRIQKSAQGGWIDLGTFNLENKALLDYLNDANSSYTDTDDATNTVMAKYVSGTYASISRKDCPAPVRITWANAASRSTVISIYEDDTLTYPIWTQNTSERATSTDIYNLIPGRTYYYSVSENGNIWEKGYFSTTGRRRMMKVSDTKGKARANNCRDLGGLEVTDNGVKKNIRYGLLFRGSCIDATTDTEKGFLVDFMNVGLDVDLRDGYSNTPGQGNDGNSVCYQAFGANYNVAYNSQKFASGKTIADLTTPEKVKNVLTDIFKTLKSGKSVYFHCHIGADRTGYMAMLIEGLLGVSQKDCSIDYELTSFSDAAGLRYRNGEPVWYTFRDGIAYLRNLPGNTFQNKIENYLVNTVGISQNQIDEFKRTVLE